MRKHILLIQDDSANARSVREALSVSGVGPFRVEWIRHCADGVERLLAEAARDEEGADGLVAVLVDLVLPDSQGIETFDRLLRADPHIPILILSDSQNEDCAKLAVQRGAQDYLLMSRLDGYSLPKVLDSMVERAAIAEALFEEKERAQVTLNSIADAVVCTDSRGRVTYLNAAAERMTGWSWKEAEGRRPAEVLQIIDAGTREPVPNPMVVAVRENKAVVPPQARLLLRRDGVEIPIEASVALIRGRRGPVTGAVTVFRDVTLAQAATARITHLAQHDALTGLPNRMLLDDRLSQAMARARRHKHKLALLFLDLNEFKQINDTLGHEVGDRLLQSVAKRLPASVRSSDTVSRQGGDEFVILLSEVKSADDAATSADKILQSLRAPHRIDAHEVEVAASIGIAVYPEDGLDAELLMKSADVAMYKAKVGGPNRYHFHAPASQGVPTAGRDSVR